MGAYTEQKLHMFFWRVWPISSGDTSSSSHCRVEIATLLGREKVRCPCLDSRAEARGKVAGGINVLRSAFPTSCRPIAPRVAAGDVVGNDNKSRRPTSLCPPSGPRNGVKMTLAVATSSATSQMQRRNRQERAGSSRFAASLGRRTGPSGCYV